MNNTTYLVVIVAQSATSEFLLLVEANGKSTYAGFPFPLFLSDKTLRRTLIWETT